MIHRIPTANPNSGSPPALSRRDFATELRTPARPVAPFACGGYREGAKSHVAAGPLPVFLEVITCVVMAAAWVAMAVGL